MTIFDLVKSTEIAAYWEEKSKDMPPYLFETLFPDEKKLEWICPLSRAQAVCLLC